MSIKCARYDDTCDCPACEDDRRQRYVTDQRGDMAGFPGWTRVLRDGQPVYYFPNQAAADAYIRNAVRTADNQAGSRNG